MDRIIILNSEIIEHIAIESAIGDGNVLNNVGKIEQFIVDQLRKFLDEYIVFPNFHAIFLQDDILDGANGSL